MRVLAIDAALPAVSACVLDSNDREPLASETIAMARGHAEELLPLIARVMASAPGGFADLDRIAVTVGPGSFTGIRVGLSAARALALATGKPAVGVSTLGAFAAPLVLTPDPRPVVACIDARHGQVYAQAIAAGGRQMTDAMAATPARIVATLGGRAWRVVGDASQSMAAAMREIGLDVEIVGSAVSPGIAYVAMLGMLAPPGDGRPRPVYLKPADVTQPALAARPA